LPWISQKAHWPGSLCFWLFWSPKHVKNIPPADVLNVAKPVWYLPKIGCFEDDVFLCHWVLLMDFAIFYHVFLLKCFSDWHHHLEHIWRAIQFLSRVPRSYDAVVKPKVWMTLSPAVEHKSCLT
jgi:hypothetical protein